MPMEVGQRSFSKRLTTTSSAVTWNMDLCSIKPAISMALPGLEVLTKAESFSSCLRRRVEHGLRRFCPALRSEAATLLLPPGLLDESYLTTRETSTES